MYDYISIPITCPNPECQYFEKEKGRHIIKWGKNRAGHQQYYCTQCKRVFVETKNTHLYYRHLIDSDIKIIYLLLMEKKSIRTIAKMTGHHQDTIRNMRDALLSDSKQAERIIFNSIKLSKSDMDNIWDTVQKTKKGELKKKSNGRD